MLGLVEGEGIPCSTKGSEGLVRVLGHEASEVSYLWV